MTDEEIQLYNDIVKIGLPVLGTVVGGIIGALSTFFITRLNHNNENKKEARRKRHELVLQTANDVAEYEHLTSNYVTALGKYIYNNDHTIDIKAAEKEFVSNNKPLRRARMNLKILGLNDSEILFEEYVEVTRKIYTKSVCIDAEELSKLARITSRGPVKFYESLSSELSIGIVK
ncbi:hypothetical protein CWC05_15400 [Pseudoalteromonas ruthenica]|uniref:Uncharacterized protein n=1 Tax=Pseudoalteromonas ruthenica TaxID=151081 RepID=A0A5S3Z300_9GAMM|nr:hypothetical protein [Pseudoalteromonas ruthenica]TMP85987.1 hypothetical protein CWC05_15400 [Pseudoalteromonas ruthenica]